MSPLYQLTEEHIETNKSWDVALKKRREQRHLALNPPTSAPSQIILTSQSQLLIYTKMMVLRRKMITLSEEYNIK